MRILLLLLMSVAASYGIIHHTETPLDFNDSALNLKTFENEHSKEHSNADPGCSSYDPHHEFTLLQNGSLLLPGSNRVHEFDTYFLANDTVFLCAEDGGQSTEAVVNDFSKEFFSCHHILIDPHEFKLLDDGHIHIDIFDKNYGPRDYYITDNGVYVCVH